MQRRLLQSGRGEASALGVQEDATCGSVLTHAPATTALLLSKLPLHGHICSQLRHAHARRHRGHGVLLCPQIKEQSRAGPDRACDPRQVLTELTAARMCHLTPADSVFQRLSATRSLFYPKRSTCSISCNRQLPLHIPSRGVSARRGALHHQQMLLCTNWPPSKSFGGSASA